MESLSSSGIRVLRYCHITDVALDQPKKESLASRFFGKREPGKESQDSAEATKTNTGENTETADPPKYSVEWFLLPKPENSAHLLEKLAFDMAKDVLKDCDEPIDSAVEKLIRKHFSVLQQQYKPKTFVYENG
ncbi:SmORF protein [Babesia bovis T2Bo]|uniref:SmORF n=1 Tax=Babesia bovis TaxID=5865 RepID=A7AWN9_BABBO|nr:SmORF protein [Babesia bovis T2Bo]EDO05467.1 SmORF protein [Babesia bovis T2Bo]|eukprot:XP_001609035.1 SmORF [Babesia bovis T2Bo]